MAASTAPSVKAALLTLLQADAGLTGVQCSYADPGQEIVQEAIFYGRTITTEQPDSFGQRKQREKYDIEVIVGVTVDGNDPQTVEERCWALVGRLEAVVRANNGNNGALTLAVSPSAGWVAMGGIEMDPFAVGGSRVAVALCKVHVEAVK